MDAILIKTIDEQGVMYSLSGKDLPENYVLSLKNCQAIELDYDLDELAEKEYPTIGKRIKSIPTHNQEGFKIGFQKALSILGDKKFSEEDMKEAYSRGFLQQGIKSFNSLIQSLQQTEWLVEICKWRATDQDLKEHLDISQPKYDVDGCLILKRKV